jgi:hypothetical protein
VEFPWKDELTRFDSLPDEPSLIDSIISQLFREPFMEQVRTASGVLQAFHGEASRMVGHLVFISSEGRSDCLAVLTSPIRLEWVWNNGVQLVIPVKYAIRLDYYHEPSEDPTFTPSANSLLKKEGNIHESGALVYELGKHPAITAVEDKFLNERANLYVFTNMPHGSLSLAFGRAIWKVLFWMTRFQYYNAQGRATSFILTHPDHEMVKHMPHEFQRGTEAARARIVREMRQKSSQLISIRRRLADGWSKQLAGQEIELVERIQWLLAEAERANIPADTELEATRQLVGVRQR